MGKADTVRLKLGCIEESDVIEVDTYMGWERVRVVGTRSKIDGPVYAVMLEFDDGSTVSDVLVDAIKWRHVPI